MMYLRESRLNVLSRRPFTLLEMMVSLGLLSILLVILFGVYHQISSAQTEMERIRERAFANRYLQTRLSDVLSKVVKPKKSGHPFFMISEEHAYAEGKSLIFTYDNGYACDRRFAGKVTGRLYLSPEKRLFLATWPLDAPTSMRKELLFEGVEVVDFVFLTNKGEIVEEWNLEQHEVPVATRITLTPTRSSLEMERKKDVTLSFSHPNAMDLIAIEGL
jgi:hypothetical protein